MYIKQRLHNAKSSPQKKINRRQISQDTFRLVQTCQLCLQSGPNNAASPSYSLPHQRSFINLSLSFLFFYISFHQALFLCFIWADTTFSFLFLPEFSPIPFINVTWATFIVLLSELFSAALLWNPIKTFLSAVWTYFSYVLKSSWFLALSGSKFEIHLTLRVVPAFSSTQLYPRSYSLFLWFSLLCWTFFHLVKLYF